MDRRYQQSVDKLEAELNSYKTNLIKESIRMGYNELGDLSYRRCAAPKKTKRKRGDRRK